MNNSTSLATVIAEGQITISEVYHKSLDSEERAMAPGWQLARYETEMPMVPSDITVLRSERRYPASKKSSDEVSKATKRMQFWNNLGVTVDNMRDMDRETKGILTERRNSDDKPQRTAFHI